MKDEQKANELANYFAGENDYKESAAYSAAMEMAQWKDEQFSKCIKNLEKEYIRNSGKGLLDDDELAAKLATLKRIEEEMK